MRAYSFVDSYQVGAVHADSPSRLRRGARAFGIGLAVSTLCAVLFASQFMTMSPRLEAREIGFAEAMWGTLGFCYVWALLTILIVPLARRFPIGQGRWRSSLGVLAGGGAVIATLHVAVFATLVWGLMRSGVAQIDSMHATEPWFAYFRAQFLTTIHSNIFVYAAILGVIHAIDYHRKYRDRDIRTSRLETQLAQAQLNALRMQLHPHFLFNTLNAIAALTRDDPRAAERMIVRLSELLRMVLDNVGAQQQPLRDEMALLGKYLEIEQVRFGGRLQVVENVSASELDTLVPTLILQPLVENAVRHGVSPHAEACVVEIQVDRHDDELELCVRDSGPGLGKQSVEDLRAGVGLSNTQERLRQLYGEDHRFALRSRPGIGFEVCITIPRRVHDEAVDRASVATGVGP